MAAGLGGDSQYCPVTQFIGLLLKLLICNNEKFGPQIEKHVKELVGHELNPDVYPILFDQIKVFVDKFFDSSGQVRRWRQLDTRIDIHVLFKPNSV